MKVLIAPMAAMAETSGPFGRASALCHKFIERNHEAAFCAAKDVNYRSIKNVNNYFAPVPSPLGLPMFLGKNLFRIIQSLGIQQKMKVNSFEQVLHIMGIIHKKHFANDVYCIRKAIQDFKPDAVYSEFRLSAIVAAKLEHVKVAAGYSYPAQNSFASNPEFAGGVREFLKEHNLPDIESVLEIFHWADLKLVPSSYELEPIDDKSVIFTGPFSRPSRRITDSPRNKIIAYMGNGTITPKTVIRELTKAFEKSKYQVYIASEQAEPYEKDNIIVGKRFHFNELMPEAAAFINHGGQNSIMTGLLYATPQIVCAGNIFERRYNASSIVKLKAGISLDAKEFRAEVIREKVEAFEKQVFYSENAKIFGEELQRLGGTDTAVDSICKMINS